MELAKLVTLADGFTALNLACGVMSIFNAISGNYMHAVLFMLGAALADFLDGKIARLFSGTGPLGKDLDSLADLVSFGVGPAVLTYTQGYSSPLHIVFLVVFVLCGCFRLARFNAVKTKHFIGVPITVNGVLFPIAFFAGAPGGVITLLHVLMSFLMISDFKIKKIGA